MYQREQTRLLRGGDQSVQPAEVEDNIPAKIDSFGLRQYFFQILYPLSRTYLLKFVKIATNITHIITIEAAVA